MSKLLTPAEVARLVRVNPTTVSRWCASGKLAHILTPGGRYRVRREAVTEAFGLEWEDE